MSDPSETPSLAVPGRVPLGAALLCGLTAGCATPVHYYAENPPVLPALDETYRPGLEQDLAQKIVASEIEEVELVEAAGTRRVRPVEGRDPQFEGELSYLRDLPFRRDAGGDGDTHAGYYVVEEGAEGGIVVLLDRAFEFDGTSFVGTPERAYPNSIAVILHEVGHAVAKLDRERLRQIYQRDRLAYNEAVPVANEFVDALNERYAIVNRLDPAQRRRLQQDIRLLERKHRKNKSLMREARRRLEELERRIQGPSPMEEAYGALPGARRGPTRYGSTSIEEGFAEAFALYHLDAEPARRISPEVHDWFAAGRHLSAALYPPLEEVEPPSTLVAPTDAASPAP